MDNKIKPRIERGITKIYISHNDEEIIFVFPSVGPNTYQKVGQEILKRKQKVPHGDYTAALVHAAYCVPETYDEQEFENIRNNMNQRWLWVFNQNLWIDQGVYVVQDTQAEGRSKSLNHTNLEKILINKVEIDGVRFSNDGTVRFAPKETYKLGEHTPESFALDGFVRATAGIVGAEQLAEVSTKFTYKPRTLGLDIEKGQKPEQRVSVLGDYDGDWLGLGGGNFGDGDDGCAFGIALAPKTHHHENLQKYLRKNLFFL